MLIISALGRRRSGKRKVAVIFQVVAKDVGVVFLALELEFGQQGSGRQRLQGRCDQLGDVDRFGADGEHVAVTGYPKRDAESFGAKVQLAVNVEQFGVDGPLIQRQR